MHVMKVVYSIGLLGILQGVAGLIYPCNDYTNCLSCTTATFLFMHMGCEWCPLTSQCHAPKSLYNDCKEEQNTAHLAKCILVMEPEMHYDNRLAVQLAKWSSLAYVPPSTHNASSIQSAVSSFISSNYQVVEFLTVDCSLIFEFDNCGVVVAKSEEDKKIIVAFEGTSSSKQFNEQLLTGLASLQEFKPTGGKVTTYNKRTHDGLYPCVKSILLELLWTRPSWEVIITGHSLGGAQAQLAAAQLVYDWVVFRSKLHVYTFGSPRVGDKEFAYGYDRLIGNSWRVTRASDPIPVVAPKILVYHTRREVFYDLADDVSMDVKSNYTICTSNEDAKCTAKETCWDEKCFADVHQMYFLKDLPAFVFDQMPLPPKTLTKHKTRSQCHSYKFDLNKKI